MKKISAVLFTLVCLFVLSGNQVFASETDEVSDVSQVVEEANSEIYALIDEAIIEADNVIFVRDVKIAILEATISNLEDLNVVLNLDFIDILIQEYENQIDLINNSAQQEVNLIIANLLEETNAISNETIEYANLYGATVICEIIEVEIGGITVDVDPLRVVEF